MVANLDRPNLVETSWLSERLEAPDVVIIDASWHLPTQNRNGYQEYLAEHIPGAYFFDIDALSDQNSSLPHMLPDTVPFASFMKALGVGDGVHVVVYDTLGIFAAARVWWMLRVMGHRDVSVLNGGLKKWKADGFALTDDQEAPRPETHFTPRMQNALIADLDDMKSLSARAQNGSGQIVDARPEPRFQGQEAEPRPGLLKGHIPGSRNTPFGAVVNDDGTMKSSEELLKIFQDSGIDPKKNVTATCGSGVSAAVLALALSQVGNDTVSVFDGSWAQWGDPSLGLDIGTGAPSEGAQ